ncbi:MAG: hypothetical protein ACR2NM_13540 [Bythopirellula sp.]
MRGKIILLYRQSWLLALLLFAGCSSGESAPGASSPGQVPAEFADLEFSSPPVVHHDDGGRVQVEVSSAWQDDGPLIVRATFSPDDSGFHLYDSQLPKAGVMGIGRPTLIEVSDAEKYASIGPMIADKTPLANFDETLKVEVPIYPDGPVTLYLPIQYQTMPDGPTKLAVQLTYMSCSKNRCNVPVERAVAELTVPALRAATK